MWESEGTDMEHSYYKISVAKDVLTGMWESEGIDVEHSYYKITVAEMHCLGVWGHGCRLLLCGTLL